MTDLGESLGSLPLVVLHHGAGDSPAQILRRDSAVACIDAKGHSLESLIRQLLASLETAAATGRVGVGASIPSGAVSGMAESRSDVVRSETGEVKPIPGRVSVGRFVPPPSRLKMHELYRDYGLLAEEARAKTEVASKPNGQSKVQQFDRRLSRDEAVAMVAEYSQARPLKSTVNLALKIARDSTATVEDMARVVKQDQALAARVLQLANCSLHRRGSAVRTVEQAIVRMGVSALRETISSSNVLDQFSEADGVMNVSLLWEHGYAVGMLAADLARATRSIPPDDAFMVGLLHDMGRAVMASELGQDYIDALLEARKHDLQPAVVEKQYFEINHADVADTLFANWEFDVAMISPIANHHLSDRNLKHLAPVHVRQTKLLQAADTLAHAALLGDSGSDWIDPRSMDIGGSPISPGLVRSCLERANKTLEELRLLNASVSSTTSAGYAAHVREQLPEGLVVGWVDNNAEVDLLGVLAWTMNVQRYPSRQTDVLLATVHTREDLDRLAKAVESHDSPDRSVPLVVSVATEDLGVKVREQFQDRPTRTLPQPFRVAWVLSCINGVLEAA